MAQKKLIKDAAGTIISYFKEYNYKLRLYCISTDGDAHRLRALASLTLSQMPSESSSLYSKSKSLKLLNLFCGHGEITSDFDWKHVLKCFRNALLRINGSTVNGEYIRATGIQKHLVDSGLLKADMASKWLNPNDRQDIVLMFYLLNAISKLPEAPEDSSPTYTSAQNVLRLLGSLYGHLLNTYTNVHLSLCDQLMHTSAAMHITCAIYRIDKTGFIPSQLMYDVQSMGKTTYFNVAKTQIDDPNGSFWIIQQGTDALEKLFGNVQTMVGTDSNVDLYQLGGRLTSAIETEKILADNPSWNPTPQRLNIPTISQQVDISQKYDHINVSLWKGNCSVKDIILRTPWDQG